jgi:hypothetical protein
MHTFHLINKKIVGLEDELIFDNIHKINFFMFNQKEYSVKNKYKFLNQTLHNIFNNEEVCDEILNIFYKIQKIYHGFARLAHIYKYKKAKIIIESDLIMNPIKENSKYVFCLFQNNYKYLFNIHELIKIINNSIANSSNFFYNPLPVKNPYNNIILNKSNLYNIYFFIKLNTLLNAEIFYYFFKSNFNLTIFVKEYQHILRDFSIQTYLNNSSKDTIYIDITNMLETFNYLFIKSKKKIIIDDSFPMNKLIEAMKPYLKIYLIANYSLTYAIREKSKKYLIYQLSKFRKINPFFGRKVFNLHNNSCTYSFNLNYKSFYEIQKVTDTDFMSNHANELGDERHELRLPIYLGLDFNNDDDDDDDDEEDNNYVNHNFDNNDE